MAEWPELAARALKEDSRGDWTGDALALYGVLLDNESHLHERRVWPRPEAARMHALCTLSSQGTCMSVLLPGQLRAEYAPRGVKGECAGECIGARRGAGARSVGSGLGRPHERHPHRSPELGELERLGEQPQRHTLIFWSMAHTTTLAGSSRRLAISVSSFECQGGVLDAPRGELAALVLLERRAQRVGADARRQERSRGRAGQARTLAAIGGGPFCEACQACQLAGVRLS